MTFKRLAEYFGKLEQISSRLKMTEILAQLFREAGADEIDKICYLSLGRLVPLYESLEFQLAEKMVVRAIARAVDKEIGEVMKLYKQKGDLGVVAQQLETTIDNSKLSVDEVYLKLRQIAEEGGEGSQERKIMGLAELFKNLDGVGVRFVARMVVGKMRLGFSDKTIIDALSWMMTGDKSLRDDLEQAYFVRADIGAIAREVKSQKVKGKSGLKKIEPVFGVPVMPALCQRLKTAQEMINKMGKVAVEPKFDGTRVQIHLAKGKNQKSKGKNDGNIFLRTFTRNLEETTHMFPELKEADKKIGAEAVILDSEAVGVDPKSGRLLSFQETIVRKRKHGVEAASLSVPLKFFVFDVLYKDGTSLLNEPLYKRRKILETLIKSGGVFELAEQIVTEDVGKLRQYHSEKLAQGLEGVVVKKWDGAYLPGRRGWNWVKFKEEEKSAGGLADTLDCVVMGYYRGKGKRVGFGIGAFLVGVKNGEKIVTVAKIGTGLTDEQWKELKATSNKQQITTKPKEYEVDKALIPDVWIEPKIVVEIAADNVTHSPNHSAGLALRFPRLVRFREDKNVEQVSTIAEVKTLFSLQGSSSKKE